MYVHVQGVSEPNSNFWNGLFIQRDEKKGMTTWVQKRMITELQSCEVQIRTALLQEPPAG
jgi:hypothetical protein